MPLPIGPVARYTQANNDALGVTPNDPAPDGTRAHETRLDRLSVRSALSEPRTSLSFAAMDEVELEIFRADTRASRGITASDIAEAAASYDPETAPAALCKGHPASDTPAFGTIKSLRADGSTLFATFPVKPELVEEVKAERLLNRSAAFFPRNHEANPKPGKFYFRHLGFLGASAPGIPGMAPLKKALAFDADGHLEATEAPADAWIEPADPTPVISFRAKEEPRTVERTPEQIAEDERLAAERTRLEEAQNAFNARVEEARKASNASLVDGLVASGKVLPKDAPRLKLVFNAIADEPLEFAAGEDKKSPAAELAAILGGAVKLVPVDEDRKSPSQQFTATDLKSDPDKIGAAARKLVEAEPGLTFEAAVERVSQQEG